MEYRQLGKSGLKVPELCFGAGTLGASGEFFEAWGNTSEQETDRILGICMDAGLNFFDTADVYSSGSSETALGKGLAKFKREDVLISTKATFRFGEGPNNVGSSRYHLIQALEGSLKRLGTDYVDVYHLHAFDATSPIEETLNTLDKMVTQGKVRYIACSNFSGWHLMKSLSISERYGWSRYVGHQVYYSLVGRDYEWELMPLALDQGVGALVWSPLGWGRLTGKLRRGLPPPEQSRLNNKLVLDAGPQVPDGVPLQRRRCDRRGHQGDRQDRPADRAQLAAAAAHRLNRRDRRTQRGAAEGQPRRDRLAAHAGADRKAR